MSEDNEVVASSGCVFCDLGLEPKLENGQWVHRSGVLRLLKKPPRCGRRRGNGVRE